MYRRPKKLSEKEAKSGVKRRANQGEVRRQGRRGGRRCVDAAAGGGAVTDWTVCPVSLVDCAQESGPRSLHAWATSVREAVELVPSTPSPS
jgi:hypothetical protein